MIYMSFNIFSAEHILLNKVRNLQNGGEKWTGVCGEMPGSTGLICVL